MGHLCWVAPRDLTVCQKIAHELLPRPARTKKRISHLAKSRVQLLLRPCGDIRFDLVRASAGIDACTRELLAIASLHRFRMRVVAACLIACGVMCVASRRSAIARIRSNDLHQAHVSQAAGPVGHKPDILSEAGTEGRTLPTIDLGVGCLLAASGRRGVGQWLKTEWE
jgi:hypothetical protein